jgi:tRNA threonylcarbamoyladenosine biosynthesis protein TsaB
MILFIDTTDGQDIVLELRDGKTVLNKSVVPAARQQSELLLPSIDTLLRTSGKCLKDIDSIMVANHGGSFTSLRIGVVTANALAYALGVPIKGNSAKDTKSKGSVSVVVPRYASDPQITVKKKAL